MLVERDTELRALSELASEVGAGAGARVAVLTGEAGTGKSRLALEFASSLPDGWTARTLRATPAWAGLPPVPESRPLALLVDDAHLLEPATLHGVLDRMDGLGTGPLLLLLTFRLGFHPASSAEMRALAGLVRDPRASELRLMPLSPSGTEQMAAAMGSYATADLHGRTGGNPFWIEEVLRGGDRVPWTVVEAVTAQLEGLPEVARDLAKALAVAAEPLPADAVSHLVADPDLATAALTEAGLARDDGGRLALRHSLAGEAVTTLLRPTELAVWHGRVAAALEGQDAELDRVARHRAAAGETDAAAAVALAVAPELRARGATRRAYQCFDIATRRPPADDLAAAELFEDAALTAARIGEYDAMRGWIQTAQRHYRAAGVPDRAASMLLDPVFDYLPVRRSDAIRDEPVERLLIDAQTAMTAGRQEIARGLLERAVEAARQRSDGMALGRAARLLVSMLGEFERGETLLEEAAQLPDIAAHPARQSRVLTIQACARFAQGYPQEAVELFRRGVAISRLDPEAVVGTGEIALANALMMIGQVEEGSAALVEASRVHPGGSPMVRVAKGYLRFERGEVDRGLEAMATGTDEVLSAFDFDPLRRSWVAAHLLEGRAQVELHGGRPAAAVRTVRRLDALSPEPFSDVAADLAYTLARAGAELEDPELLEEARRRIGDLSRAAAGPGLLAIAEAVRGFAARLQGRADEASRRFWAAASLCERAPRAILAAELWCEAARTGQRSAPAALERAARVSREHGIARVGARIQAVRAELAATPARVPTALAELTSRERDVVLLAAEGLINRDIGSRLYLSEGTVRNYLSVAFGKLGVSRRAELGRLLARPQLTD